MTLIQRCHLAVFLLALLFVSMDTGRADDPLVLLLTHPETGLAAAWPDAAGFRLGVDGEPTMTGAPTVLLKKSSGEADFIAAVWNDASGKKVHQREVFVVKPAYAVVVDHLYTPAGVHTLIRQMGLPAGGRTDGAAAEVSPAGGKTFRVQANDDPKDKVRAELKDNLLTLSAPATLPAPLSTAFLAGTDLPKITYVKAANPMVVKAAIKFANGREDEIAIAWESRPLHVGGKALNGWAACVSKGPDGEKRIEILP